MTMLALNWLLAMLGGAPLMLPDQAPAPRAVNCPAKPRAGNEPQNRPELPWYTTGFG